MNKSYYQDYQKVNINIWGKYTSIITKPPRNVPSNLMVDGPLMGNGDVGVTMGGPAEYLDFYIGKNDFWYQAHIGETKEQRMERLYSRLNRRTGTHIMMVGLLSLVIPDLKNASYYVEQDIYNAEIRGEFIKDNTSLKTTSYVSATQNIMIITLENTGKTYIDIELRQKIGKKGDYEVYGYDQGEDKDISYMTRHANISNIPGSRSVAVATRVLTSTNVKKKQNLCYNSSYLTLEPCSKAVITVSIISDLDNEQYLSRAKEMLISIDQSKLEKIKEAHRNWWKEYWMKSSIFIDNQKLLKYYYTSYYVLGCCTRAGKVPPGLFGNWITTDKPIWTGSYTMNYNYQSPFWCLYTGNRQDIIESYYEPLLDIIPLAKDFAKKYLGCNGIYVPVELGPWGTVCSMLFWGQKSNAAFGAVNMIMHYQVTRDIKYGAKIYPYLIEVINFWEDYLVFEDGRYVIYNDSAHEGEGDNKNPIVSLGLIKMIIKTLISLSNDLGCDKERCAKWNYILKHLSPFPTFERNDQVVFRLTEEGLEWIDGNAVALQHVYPGGCIGLDSDPKLLKIAQNTVMQKGSWFGDGNAFPSIYPMAARVGINADEIIKRLKIECENMVLPNGFFCHGGGGIEDANGITATLNEMLMQSHEDIIRLFPVWLKEKNAIFHRLRAYGAFLVSAEYRNGKVQHAIIESEKGVDCTIQNPWQTVYIYCDDKFITESSERRFTFKTYHGKTYLLLPKT